MEGMTDKPVWSHPNVSIHVMRDLPGVRLEWHGQATSGTYRHALEHALEVVIEQGARCWLGDVRDMGTVSREDEQWTVTEWFPRLWRCGIRRMAVLEAFKPSAQASVDRIMSAAFPVLDFEVAHFTRLEDAMAWLAATPA